MGIPVGGSPSPLSPCSPVDLTLVSSFPLGGSLYLERVGPVQPVGGLRPGEVLPAAIGRDVPGGGGRGGGARGQAVLHVVHHVLRPEVGVRDLHQLDGGGETSHPEVGHAHLGAGGGGEGQEAGGHLQPVDDDLQHLQHPLVHSLLQALNKTKSNSI